MLMYAVIAINLALVFYTIGVWSEKISGVLKGWHLIMFGAGLVFDTIGTTLMSRIAKVHFQLNFHGITGLLAIILMLIHAVWATMVLYSDKDEAKRKFHKFSIAVWLIWLIPFMSGAIFGMMK